MAQFEEPIVGTVGMGTSFNFQDVFWNIGGGLESPKYQASLQGGFGFRIGSKKLLVETGNNTFDQFRERRYLFTLAAEKRFTVLEVADETMLQLFGMLQGSYTFGDYRGVGYGPSKGFLFHPAGGIAIGSSGVIARLGYTYLPLQTESISPHRIFISFNAHIIP